MVDGFIASLKELAQVNNAHKQLKSLTFLYTVSENGINIHFRDVWWKKLVEH